MRRGANGVWSANAIFVFEAGFPGWAPYAGLVVDKAGHLYGTTIYGGNLGSGAVFELAQVKGVWQETVIHNFGAGDGIYPYGPLAIDQAGNLYGTTFQSLVGNVGGAGIVFELSMPKPSVWQETILHNFVNPGDGGNPYSGVALDCAGRVYGTTYAGGVAAGIVFELTPPKSATATTITSSPNPSIYGQAVRFTATVSSCVGSVPDGETVTFKQGAVVLGTETLRGGAANFSASTLGAGTKQITAVYGGDAKFAASASTSESQVIAKATSGTRLTSSHSSSSFDQAVTFTATVAPRFGGTPTGTVTFENGSATLGVATLSAGRAEFTTSALAVGVHSITAVYGGSANFGGSTSAVLSQTVNKAATSTALVSSPNPSTVGQTITFSATVKAATSGTPTGAVTFKDGTTTLGTGSLAAGKAIFQTSKLAKGTHTITAVYGGNTDYLGSNSLALTQTVN